MREDEPRTNALEVALEGYFESSGRRSTHDPRTLARGHLESDMVVASTTQKNKKQNSRLLDQGSHKPIHGLTKRPKLLTNESCDERRPFPHAPLIFVILTRFEGFLTAISVKGWRMPAFFQTGCLPLTTPTGNFHVVPLLSLHPAL